MFSHVGVNVGQPNVSLLPSEIHATMVLLVNPYHLA